MIERILKEQFDVLLDAPESVPKLREMILQLAVMGKLVPQDPNDEPASELLKRIASEKEKLNAQGRIKRVVEFDAVGFEERPFPLPTGWEWARFGEVVINRDGERVPIAEEERQHRRGEYDYYGASGVIDKIDGYLFAKPLLLIGEDGANLLRRSTPIAFIAHGKYWVNNHAHVLDGLTIDLLRYCEVFINAIDLSPYVTGTAQPKMNQAKMNSIVVALPPETEQKRIVEKVDRLMAFCDELDARQKERESVQIAFSGAALSRLTEVQEPMQFTVNLNRVKSHFDLIVHRPEDVKKVRETILQLAVMGKLVPQDPNDEPAAELLKRIGKEKERLIAEGKIKRPKELPPVGEDEKAFPLPKGWEWVRLGAICKKITDGTHHSPPNTHQGKYKYVTAKNIKNEGVVLKDITYVSETVHREIFSRCNPEPGDVLYIKDGATTGIVTINNLPEPFSMLSSVALIKLPAGVLNRYLLHIMRSPFFYAETRGDMTGVGIPRVTLSKMEMSIVPLPPLAEQKHIVDKVDLLMAICDELEAGLTKSREEGTRLLEAVVAGVGGNR